MANTNISAFPYSAPTDLELTVASDDAITALSGGIDAVQTSFDVVDGTVFNTPTLVVIDGEIIRVGSRTGNTLSGCDRGFAGTTPASHTDTTDVFGYILSYQHNQLAAEVKSLGAYIFNADLSGLKLNQNLVLYSEALENPSWIKASGSTIPITSASAPTGAAKARTVLEGSVLGAHGISALPTGLQEGQTYCFSVYAKFTNNPWIVIGQNVSGETGKRAWFNLETGKIGTIGSSTKAALVPLGNGWYRCMVVTTCTANGYKRFDILLASDDGVASYVGHATNSVELWGAQVHSGDLNGPVTYVATTGTSFTSLAGGDLILDEGDIL